MQIKKLIYGQLDKAYCLNFLKLKDGMAIVAASEKRGGACSRYDFATGAETPVWTDAGGTMTICQTGDDGSFLAVQNFFMGFQAETARIVRAIPEGDGYRSDSVYTELPFVHRFGLISAADGSETYLVACTVTTAKDKREDWSRPGSVLVSPFADASQPPKFTEIAKMHKNHGYWHGKFDGDDLLFLSGQEGLMALYPPKTKGQAFQMTCILPREISDAVAVDIDGDGQDEILAIEGFHGNHVTLNKRVAGTWQVVYEFEAEFAHALWAGNLLGQNSFLVSYRRNAAELLLLRMGQDGNMVRTCIASSIATPNIDVYQEDGKAYVVAADRSDPQSEKTVVYVLSENA